MKKPVPGVNPFGEGRFCKRVQFDVLLRLSVSLSKTFNSADEVGFGLYSSFTTFWQAFVNSFGSNS